MLNALSPQAISVARNVVHSRSPSSGASRPSTRRIRESIGTTDRAWCRRTCSIWWIVVSRMDDRPQLKRVEGVSRGDVQFADTRRRSDPIADANVASRCPRPTRPVRGSDPSTAPRLSGVATAITIRASGAMRSSAEREHLFDPTDDVF